MSQLNNFGVSRKCFQPSMPPVPGSTRFYALQCRQLTNSHIYKLSTWPQLMTRHNIQNDWLQQLDTEDFQTVVVADCNPVWLS